MKARFWSFGRFRSYILAALLSTSYLGNAQLNFVETSGSLFGEDEISLAEYEDVDGDNDLDALIVGRNTAGLFSKLYINDGTGKFTEKKGVPFLGVFSGAAAFADIDNDNDQDLVISGETDDVLRNTELYINDGFGNFTQEKNHELVALFLPTIKFTDIDFDGDMDLFLSGYSGGPSSKLYINKGNGTFGEYPNHLLPNLALGSVWFFDYDKDGDMDFFGTGTYSNNVHAYLFVSQPVHKYFLKQKPPGSQFGKSGVVDLDGDTFLDIFYTGSLKNGDKEARLFLNSQSGDFTETSILEIEPVDNGDIEFYDFDGDNDLDLLMTGSNSEGLPSTMLYMNDGNAGFIKFPEIPFAKVSGSTLKVADFNGDGIEDVLLTGETEEGTFLSKLYLNQATVNTPPTVSQLSIEGDPEIGQQVSLSYDFYDAEGDEDESDFFWYRANDNVGTNKTEIVGATGNYYVLSPLDEAKFLQAEVIPKDGTSEGERMKSSWFGPIEERKPEIQVQGNSQIIAPETNVPSLEEHTYFGETPMRVGSEQRSFMILNTGSAALVVNEIIIEGRDADDFDIIGDFPQSISPGENITISINFTPKGLGEKEAQLAIESSDLEINPYTFNILGKGVNTPPYFISGTEFDLVENEENWQVDIDASNGEGDPADEEVTYSIIGGEDSRHFTIDPGTGVVMFAFIPDFEAPVDFDLNNEYLLEVSADDSSPENNLTTQTIRIKILDFDEDPIASCVPPFEVYLDMNGEVRISPEEVDKGSTDDSGKFTMTVVPNVFSYQDIGTHEINLTITDENNNVSVCSTSITVRDTISPTVIVRNITIPLDETGQAFITPKDIDDGSNDISGIASLTLDKTVFSCADLGNAEVILTVMDNNGNSNSAISTVTVEDPVPPVLKFSNSTVFLDVNGEAIIDVEDIDNGSFDTCGAVTLNLERTEVNCSDVGVVPIKLTGVDSSGNISEGMISITVKDTISPVVSIQNLVVKLDEYGRASITPEGIDHGSSDNCGSVNVMLEKSEFDCSNVGENEVGVIIEDTSGNRSTATAIVTVVDEIAPLGKVKELVVQLDELGKIEILPEDFDNGSSDACGELSFSLNRVEFSCSELGENILLLTIMDTYGNTTETDVRLIVEDKTFPMAYLEENYAREVNSDCCTYKVSGEEFDISLEDNCGIETVVNDYNGKSTLMDASFPTGETIVNWTISDKGGNTLTVTSRVVVTKTAPELLEITGSESSVLAGTQFELWADYKDGNIKKAEWYFSSGGEDYDFSFPGVLNGAKITGAFELPSNVYRVKLVAEDGCGDTVEAYLDYLSVYDPEGGFVTGSGWINIENDLKRSGSSMKANFSINVKYKSGNRNNHQVQGNSSFNFKAEGLNFKSTSYEDKSLVISGEKAIFKGVGKVNGSGKHKFLMVAIDGNLSQPFRNDGLRIQIMKDGSEEVLYDSNPLFANNSSQSLELGGGSIVIHKAQGNSGGRNIVRANSQNGTASGKEKSAKPEQPSSKILIGSDNELEISENSLVISPNPIEGRAEIFFRWGQQAKVTLSIFDFNGREIFNLFRGQIEKNQIYRVELKGENLQPGVYFCRLALDTGEVIDKQLMVK